MRIVVTPAPGISAWAFEDTTVNGQAEFVDPDESLAAALGAALAAGILELVESDSAGGKAIVAAVETDEQSLARQADLVANQDDNARAVYLTFLAEDAASRGLVTHARDAAGQVLQLDCDPEHHERAQAVLAEVNG